MNWKTNALIAMLLFSIMNLLISSQLKRGLSIPFIMFVIAIMWLIGYGYMTFKEGVNFTALTASTIVTLLIISLLSFFGNWALFEAIKQVKNPGFPLAISSCGIVIVTVVSYLLNKAPISPMEIIGISMGFGGVVILNLSK